MGERRSADGNMEGIDALLGKQPYLVSPVLCSVFEKTKEQVSLALTVKPANST
jgi:hypothetical protein